MPSWEAQPFRNSLSTLAALAMRETGAEGYGYFERVGENGALKRLFSRGVTIMETALDAEPRPASLATYPLRRNDLVDGILAFAFPNPWEPSGVRVRLDQIAERIAMVWSASGTPQHYHDLIVRLGELETQLLDSKIADRAHGFLSSGSQQDLAGTIARHVDGILRPTETRRVLEKIVQDLEAEVEERQMTAVAKAVLQGATGMSEEEAHAHLRALSRRSRKPLREVALALIKRQSISRASL